MSTYTPIASQTLSAAASSVTFSGIPQNYTDLVLVFAGAITTGFDAINMQFNGDTGTTYSRTVLAGNGSSATSSRDSNASSMQIGIMGTEQSNSIWNVMNYSNSTTYKTVLSRGNSSANSVRANVGLWRNTAAITSITITAASSTFISGSTFNLYGIASGSPKAFGGDIFTTDGTYYYHTFLSSGTFTPTQALSNVDYLVVAGGGGGGHPTGGGGGAGGFRTSIGGSPLSLTAQAYTVTVGAGGNKGSSSAGSSGSNSVFSTITSTGGGGGGTNGGNGLTGGSGGGGGYNTGTGASGNTPSTTPSQGNSGGNGANVSGGGGGGGAGAVGANAGSGFGGNGGNGLASSISGTSVTYAGGGGGAGYVSSPAPTGGTGGGGNGTVDGGGNATSGTANTGGGGGSCHNSASQSGNGGSGIVIIRYAV